MRRKTMLAAAAALAALAFAALPSMAMAEETTPEFWTTPALSFASYPQHFTGTSGGGSLYIEGSAAHAGCKRGTAEGEFENAHTGWLKITFTECTETALGSKCYSNSANKGTIETEELTFHTVYIDPEGGTTSETPHERPGILITPNHETGHFATFECAGGLKKITVGGNGVLGTVTEPGLEESGKEATIDITANATEQQHTTTIDTEEVGGEHKIICRHWGLEANEGKGLKPAFENSTEDAITFQEEGTTTTETP
jgi:hypothetical protein